MKKKYLQLIVGLVISALFIYLALWWGNVSYSELWSAIAKTNWWWGAAMIAVTMLSFYWRAFRWKIMLDPVKKVTAARLFDPLMVGFAFNNVLPARAGEIARPFALKKKEGVPFGAGLSTVVVERFVDVLTLLVFLIIMPYIVTFDETVTRSYSLGGGRTVDVNAAWIQDNLPKMSVLALVLLCGIVSFLIPPIKEFYFLILRKMPVIPDKFKEKLIDFANGFVEGFNSLKSFKAVVLVIIHSAIIWLLIAFGYQVMAWGFPGVEMSFNQAIAFMVIVCVVISIPSSPGFFGVFEFGGVVALVMMGLVPNTPEGGSQAFAYTLVAHFLQWAPTTIVGLISATRLSISASEAEAVAEETHVSSDMQPADLSKAPDES